MFQMIGFVHHLFFSDRDGKESKLVLDIQRPGFVENDDPSVNTTEVEGRYLALRDCVQRGSFDIITSSREDDMVQSSAVTYVEKTSLDLLQQLPAEDLYMAWYPMAYANMYKACFIKIRSTCPDTEVRQELLETLFPCNGLAEKAHTNLTDPVGKGLRTQP